MTVACHSLELGRQRAEEWVPGTVISVFSFSLSVPLRHTVDEPQCLSHARQELCTSSPTHPSFLSPFQVM